MKIALISRSDLEDRLFWSGTIETIYSNLKLNKKLTVIKIDKLNNSLRKIYALKREFLRLAKNEKFDDAYNEKVSKNFSQQIKQKLNKLNDIDFIVCFDLSLIAYLNVKIPIILWTDILYLDYYEHYYSNLVVSKKTLTSISNIEKKGIKKCYRIILSSRWAIKNAINRYKYQSRKFSYIPFGPNLKIIYKKEKIKKIIKQRPKKKLSLITLSVEWKRKGIEKLIDLKKSIEKKGIETKLTIIGTKKINKYCDKNIKFVGFINKNTYYGEKRLSNYLLKSHYHVLFSDAEAYGVALVEANSLGVPNIAYKIGGIKQIIKNKVNGMSFKSNTQIDYIAEQIKKNFSNNKKYVNFAESSFNYYNKNFSHKVIINKFLELLSKNI